MNLYICPTCGIPSKLTSSWVVNPSSAPVEHKFSFCGHKVKWTALQIAMPETIPYPVKEKDND